MFGYFSSSSNVLVRIILFYDILKWRIEPYTTMNKMLSCFGELMDFFKLLSVVVIEQ